MYYDKLKMCNDRELLLWMRCLWNIFFLGDESFFKRICDDYIIDVVKEDLDDLGSGGDFEKLDDIIVIYDIVVNNVGDICD